MTRHMSHRSLFEDSLQENMNINQKRRQLDAQEKPMAWSMTVAGTTLESDLLGMQTLADRKGARCRLETGLPRGLASVQM
jgi:hypothetical protein